MWQILFGREVLDHPTSQLIEMGPILRVGYLTEISLGDPPVHKFGALHQSLSQVRKGISYPLECLHHQNLRVVRPGSWFRAGGGLVQRSQISSQTRGIRCVRIALATRETGIVKNILNPSPDLDSDITSSLVVTESDQLVGATTDPDGIGDAEIIDAARNDPDACPQ